MEPHGGSRPIKTIPLPGKQILFSRTTVAAVIKLLQLGEKMAELNQVIFHTSHVEDDVKSREQLVDEVCHLRREVNQLRSAEMEKSALIYKLQEALAQVKGLSGILPICAGCKKIRDQKGEWQGLETYIMAYTDAVFSHGICPDCAQKLYGRSFDEAP